MEEQVYNEESDDDGAGKIYDHIIYQKRPDKFKEEVSQANHICALFFDHLFVFRSLNRKTSENIA